MLFYIFHPDYQIILIDEPELHLHPSVLKRFLRILQKKMLEMQTFFTTHNSVFVNPETLEHLWRITRDDNGHTKIYTLANATVNIPKKRLFQELNADNTEMFFADKVLLVEGISDRILLRGLIDRFYKGKRDIKVVYMGSKGNVDVYADLCHAFNIPYAVMLDCDALKGTWANLLSRRLKGYQRTSTNKKIKILSEKAIFILDCVLEDSYPKKYQKRDTKPLNALRAANMITEEDLRSSKMSRIREVIEKL
jgi:predicted ATP-dependent endonuclease of OLD family